MSGFFCLRANRCTFWDAGCGLRPEAALEVGCEGMGLGLAIVKKMLANMNGTIDIESTKDVGAVVIITVPEGGS
jgi:signal transduction histidine kinase